MPASSAVLAGTVCVGKDTTSGPVRLTHGEAATDGPRCVILVRGEGQVARPDRREQPDLPAAGGRVQEPERLEPQRHRRHHIRDVGNLPQRGVGVPARGEHEGPTGPSAVLYAVHGTFRRVPHGTSCNNRRPPRSTDFGQRGGGNVGIPYVLQVPCIPWTLNRHALIKAIVAVGHHISQCFLVQGEAHEPIAGRPVVCPALREKVLFKGADFADLGLAHPDEHQPAVVDRQAGRPAVVVRRLDVETGSPESHLTPRPVEPLEVDGETLVTRDGHALRALVEDAAQPLAGGGPRLQLIPGRAFVGSHQWQQVPVDLRPDPRVARATRPPVRPGPGGLAAGRQPYAGRLVDGEIEGVASRRDVCKGFGRELGLPGAAP